MKFTVVNENTNLSVRLTQAWEDEVLFLKVTADFSRPLSPKPVHIDFFIDCIDIYSVFSPTVDFNTTLSYDWAKTTSVSRICAGTPIHSLLSLDGENRLTIALDDGIFPSSISSGVREEDGTLACRITLFASNTGVLSDYTATARLDFQKIPFYRAVREAELWQRRRYAVAPVPDCALDPVFSTWYCYHQQLDAEDILKECANARALGLKTLIVDDGWQTDDLSRGYAYCGDWQIASKKIPDMHDFIRRVHALDVKVLFWFGLPFVGSKSKAFARLKDYVLEDLSEDFEGQATLDPRFPFVREYVQNTVVGFFEKYDLDGLKLDFIEAFAAKSAKSFDERWDTLSVEEGVNKLLSGIYTAMTRIKPNAMIEFRQPYLSPAIRRYGNLFRVSDCPDDMMKNRFYSINLRLVLGSSAVHSDMLLWNQREKDSAVFRQLCSTLFTVPQISMKPSALSPAHERILSAFLRYHESNRTLLLSGDLECSRPEAHYALVWANGENKRILLAYLAVPIPVDDYDETDILNCTVSDVLLLTVKGEEYFCEIVDIYGNKKEAYDLRAEAGTIRLQVPTECYIHVKRVR